MFSSFLFQIYKILKTKFNLLVLQKEITTYLKLKEYHGFHVTDMR